MNCYIILNYDFPNSACGKDAVVRLPLWRCIKSRCSTGELVSCTELSEAWTTLVTRRLRLLTMKDTVETLKSVPCQK